MTVNTADGWDVFKSGKQRVIWHHTRAAPIPDIISYAGSGSEVLRVWNQSCILLNRRKQPRQSERRLGSSRQLLAVALHLIISCVFLISDKELLSDLPEVAR